MRAKKSEMLVEEQGRLPKENYRRVKVFAWSDARSNDSLSMAYFFLKEG